MSRRVLITGASGFAGSHLAAACRDAGDEVVALSRGTTKGSDHPSVADRDDETRATADATRGSDPCVADLLDADATAAALAAAAPEIVYHLAALAHVARSWNAPEETLRDNQAMLLHVLEAVREHAPDATVVAVSSGEVYGPPASLPVDEDAALRPRNPYAVSKATGELLAGFYADAHGLRIVRPRAFNHAGPGQPPLYALASFARQVAAGLEAGDAPIRVMTGNPDTRRDFTDVRDVVRAYRLLAERRAIGPVNVCSGRSVSASELVAGLGEATGAEIAHEVDPALVRAHDVMEIRGSPARLHALTGWEPELPLATTLADTVAWWRAQLRAGRAGDGIHE